MSKYTVKNVVKKEQKLEKLNDPQAYKMRDNWLFPMGLTAAMSAMMTTSVGLTGIMENQPVLGAMAAATALLTAYSGKRFTDLLVQNETKNRLYEELNEIYNEMGEDFKAQVMEQIEADREKRINKQL